MERKYTKITAEWISWECPDCGQTHSDPELQETMCDCGCHVLVDGEHPSRIGNFNEIPEVNE